MSSYTVRRSRNPEDSTDELKSSNLFLINDTKSNKTDGKKVFVLKWVINQPTKLMSGIVYAAHHITLDNTIRRLRVSRLENRDSRRIVYLIGMTPYWGTDIDMSFIIVENDFEIKPDPPSGHVIVPDRKCFFEFVEYFSLRNTLTVLITIVCKETSMDIDINKHSDLVPDMQGLLDTGNLSDFTMVVGGEEFRLHMAILSARSPVFSAMFNSDMQEKNTRRLVIEDPSDRRTFWQFVSYIYTGKTKPLDSKLALGLLEWADKYQVAGLRKEAVEFLMFNLDKDYVLPVFVAADAIVETGLKKAACLYIIENLSFLMRSSDWSYVENRADLLNDLLKEVAS